MTLNRILIVDDDKIICNVISNLLEEHGFQPNAVYSGEEAIELLERERFLAVITDLKMGNIDGFEVTRTCKRIAPETRVIMITGSCEGDDERTAFQCGASTYLAKPFDLDELLDSLPENNIVQAV